MDDYLFNSGATWSDGAEMPEDAVDLRDAASVRVSLEAIGDNTAILDARWVNTSLQRVLPMHAGIYVPSYWQPNSAGDYVTQAGNLGNASAMRLRFPLHLPDGATLTAFQVLLQGASGHGALPSVMPSVVIRQKAHADGSQTVLATQADTSASTGGYETAHVINQTLSTPAAINNSLYGYGLEIAHESGTNSIEAGLKVLTVRWTCSTGYRPKGVW